MNILSFFLSSLDVMTPSFYIYSLETLFSHFENIPYLSENGISIVAWEPAREGELIQVTINIKYLY